MKSILLKEFQVLFAVLRKQTTNFVVLFLRILIMSRQPIIIFPFDFSLQIYWLIFANSMKDWRSISMSFIFPRFLKWLDLDYWLSSHHCTGWYLYYIKTLFFNYITLHKLFQNLPKTGATNFHAQLGFLTKGRAIKGLFFCI